MQKRNPVFTFDDVTSLGINAVPLDNTVLVVDYDGLGNALQVVKIKNTGMGDLSTIHDFLNDESLYNYVKTMLDIDGGNF